jgi:hypothetical protein
MCAVLADQSIARTHRIYVIRSKCGVRALSSVDQNWLLRLNEAPGLHATLPPPSSPSAPVMSFPHRTCRDKVPRPHPQGFPFRSEKPVITASYPSRPQMHEGGKGPSLSHEPNTCYPVTWTLAQPPARTHCPTPMIAWNHMLFVLITVPICLIRSVADKTVCLTQAINVREGSIESICDCLLQWSVTTLPSKRRHEGRIRPFVCMAIKRLCDWLNVFVHNGNYQLPIYSSP